MILTPSLIVVGLNATFKALSTEDYMQRLKTVHHFPEVVALSLAENLSVYRDDPEAWIEGNDFGIQDVCSYCSSTNFSLLLIARSSYQIWKPGTSISTRWTRTTFPSLWIMQKWCDCVLYTCSASQTSWFWRSFTVQRWIILEVPAKVSAPLALTRIPGTPVCVDSSAIPPLAKVSIMIWCLIGRSLNLRWLHNEQMFYKCACLEEGQAN